MTTFYHIARKDYDGVFADAMMVGSYVQLPRCPACKVAMRRREPPLIIEWEAGSNLVADFTWPATLEEVVVTERVKSCFVECRFNGFRFDSVEMVQKPSLRKPRKPTKARNRVWLPYDGPPLWSLAVTSSCRLDLEKSARSLVTECEACNRTRMIVHDSKASLVIQPESWEGTDLFLIQEMGGVVFVGENVRNAILEHGFTNVDMKPRGSVPK